MWLVNEEEPHCNMPFAHSLGEADLDCALAPFAVSNTQIVFDLLDENFTVSNLARGSRRGDCVEHFLS